MMKIKLNKNEIRALVSLLVNAEYSSIGDNDLHAMTQELAKGIIRRLSNRLLNLTQLKNEYAFTFKPAEMAALHQVFKTYLPLRLDIYEDTLVTKINMIIEQKAA